MLNLIHDPIHALEEFIKLSSALSQERDLNRLLNQIVSTARQLTGAEMGCLYLLDQTKTYLYPEVMQNDALTSSLVKDLPQVSLQLDERLGASHLCAYAAISSNSVKLPDVYRYSGFDCADLYRYDEWKKYRCQSLLAVPMKGHAGFTIGILQLINRRTPGQTGISEFPDAVMELTEAFASQAAVVVDNTRLIEENQGLIEELRLKNKYLKAENVQLKQKIASRCRFTDKIIGDSPAMQQVFDLMSKAAASDITVFLGGETGTGKELVATAIHQSSSRHKGRLVAQNCGALPENLLESELFGYKRGAFSGADKDKQGLIEAADGGTLFLDEIGDMPQGLQVKLLRVLQERTVRPVGSVEEERRVDFRVIAATHKNPEELVKEGRLREDLYFRLHQFPIEIPPLRMHKEDLPQLLRHFLKQYAESEGKQVHGFSPEALAILTEYDYPGNIRELKSLVQYAVVLCDGNEYILPRHLSRKLSASGPLNRLSPAIEVPLKGSWKEIMQEYEIRILQAHLQLNQGNQTKTAEKLGISRRALVDKISRYQLKNGD